MPLLGYIPDDRAVIAAINRHESFMEQNCPAREAMERIAQRFLGEYVAMPSFEPKKRLFGCAAKSLFIPLICNTGRWNLNP